MNKLLRNIAFLLLLVNSLRVFGQAPVISSFSPANGYTGSSVTINGSNFNENPAGNIVYFGATRATVNTASAAQLTVNTPAGATYSPISVLNTSTHLIAYSSQPYLNTFPTKRGIYPSDFDPEATITGDNYRPIVKIADIDGDGKDDIISAGQTNSSLFIYRNISVPGSLKNNSFDTKLEIPAGQYIKGVTIADMNGDGLLDVMLVAGAADSQFFLFLNTSTPGNISFSNAYTFDTGVSFLETAVADFDGDGKPDFAILTESNSIILYHNTSPALGTTTGISFAPVVTLATGSGSNHISITDIDGDGKPDIVESEAAIAVFRNTSTPGNVSFDNTAVRNSVGYAIQTFSLVDIDGDGKADIAFSDAYGELSLIRNISTAGNIGFEHNVDFSITGTSVPSTLSIGDIDGDGEPDFVLSGGLNKNVGVMRNTSKIGSITSQSVAPLIELPISGISVVSETADLDGDGKPDLVVNNGGSISILRNNPTALVSPPIIQKFSPAAAPYDAIITITGSFFSGATAVRFGGAPATSFKVISPDTLTAVVSSASVSGNIVVTTNNGIDSVGTFTFIPPPSVSSFSPLGAGKGSMVTITGTGFTNAGSVRFGGAPAASFTVVSATSIQAVVGAGSTGNVSVTSNSGTGALAGFKYPPPVITAGGPQVFVAGKSISPLNIVNSGGAVPNGLYGQTSTYAGSATVGAVNATGTKASFNIPGAVAADTAGNIYVADQGNNLIRKIALDGQVSTYAGTGAAGNADGPNNIASFNAPRGLAFDNFGNLYVSTLNDNLIRKITRNGGVTTLAGGGAAGADGADKSAGFNKPMGLATDLAGNIYVADENDNSIRKISPAGVVTTLAGGYSSGSVNGEGKNATFNLPAALTVDGNGNVYVAEYFGNEIRKITPGGLVTTFAGDFNYYGYTDANGSSARFSDPDGIAIDGDGNLYVSDLGNYVVRKILPDATVSTLAGAKPGLINGIGTAASFDILYNLGLDNNGNLFVADAGNQVIRKISTVGYSVSPALPEGLTLNENGTITGTPASATPAADYTITAWNGSGSSSCKVNIGVIVPSQPAITSFTPVNGGVGDSITIKGIGFTGASAITFGAVPATAFTVLADTIIIATVGAGNTGDVSVNTPAGTAALSGFTFTGPKINAFAPAVAAAGETVTITGSGFSGATAVTFGNVPAASFTVISSSAISAVVGAGATGQVSITTPKGTAILDGFVVTPTPPANISYPGSQVYTINVPITPLAPVNTGSAVPATIYAQAFTFAGSGFVGNIDGQGKLAAFNSPLGITADQAGNLYVTDEGNASIRKITPGGLVTTFATHDILGPVDKDGLLGFAGIAADAAGNLYMAFFTSNLIKKITPKGEISIFAGSGLAGSTDGPAAVASFNGPYGIAVDTKGVVYVCEELNHMIRKITPDGVVSTLAGNTVYGNNNGTGMAASFNSPRGVAVDGAGNVYVADTKNNLIRKITADGVVTTLAGSGKAELADGTGTEAGINFPIGLTTDISGNVYVAADNHIRKITPSGVVTTLIGKSDFGSNDGVGATAGVHPYCLVIDNAGLMYVTESFDNSVKKVILSGYTISPALPAGLSFDSTTGIISGTPTQLFPATDFTITAYNKSGFSTTIVNISVNPFELPDTNFTVKVTAATCDGAKDGMIDITAKQLLSYQAVITDSLNNIQTLTFSQSLNIKDLKAGVYNLCITVAGIPGYQQCYSLTISEPPKLSLYAVVNQDLQTVNISLSGGAVYFIALNQQTFQTTEPTINLPLQKGNNVLTVTTDKPCQGTITQRVIIGPGISYYPNPVISELNIDLGADTTRVAGVVIDDVYGRKMYENRLNVNFGKIRVSLSNLDIGVYIVRLTLDKSTLVFKIWKE